MMATKMAMKKAKTTTKQRGLTAVGSAAPVALNEPSPQFASVHEPLSEAWVRDRARFIVARARVELGRFLADDSDVLRPVDVDLRQTREVLDVMCDALAGDTASVAFLAKASAGASRVLGGASEVERRSSTGSAEVRHVARVVRQMTGRARPVDDGQRRALAQDVLAALGGGGRSEVARALRRRWKDCTITFTKPIDRGSPEEANDLPPPAPDEEAAYAEEMAEIARAERRWHRRFLVGEDDVLTLERWIASQPWRTGKLPESGAEALVQRALTVAGVDRPENLVRGGTALKSERKLKPDRG